MTVKVKAIALCRVSSVEQLKNASLSRQEIAVNEAAKRLDVEIVRTWSGQVSSKAGTNLQRKDLNEMLEVCRKDASIKYLIVDEVDRFMRSIEELFWYRVEFRKLGVEIEFASQPELNNGNTMAKLLIAFKSWEGESSNDERAHKSIVGQAAALRAGRYPYRPKPGYIKGDIPGWHKINPRTGPILREILIGVAEYKFTRTEALKRLNDSEFTEGKAALKMDKFRRILTDPYYAGIVEMNEQVVERNESGVHDRMITRRQHDEIIKIMNGKPKNQKGPGLNGNPAYPLSNLVTCHECKGDSYPRFAGFNHGNGSKNGRTYEKYRCRSCGRYVSKAELHSRVGEHIKRYRLSKENRTKLISQLEKVWKTKESDNARGVSRIRLKVNALNAKKMNQIEALANPSNEFMRDELTESIQSLKHEVARLTQKADDMTAHTAAEKTKFLTFALDKIDNFDVTFLEMPHEQRLLCKQLVFPDGFAVDSDNNVLTPNVSVFNRVNFIKIDPSYVEESHMVRVRRL